LSSPSINSASISASAELLGYKEFVKIMANRKRVNPIVESISKRPLDLLSS
jgi:hypothetical protein